MPSPSRVVQGSGPSPTTWGRDSESNWNLGRRLYMRITNFSKTALTILLILIIISSSFTGINVFAAQTITLNGSLEGRVFEGIGACSAGASSRLLIDYSDPYRSQILDYLFKPNYGAGFQHLKVEIGGDINSTDGCEPSHMHSRTDENYNRGYEWFLMKEAKNRNSGIYLDCLEWGAPGWIGNGQFYSQDNADYIVKFIKGAKNVHNLDMDYVGIWNETGFDTNWIKLLRQTLDSNGLASVKIVAADQVNSWNIVDYMNADPALKNAVAVVGVHYPGYNSTQAAKDCGKPLWSSEDGPWNGTWGGACSLAKMYNRNYISGKMTKTVIWSPITSYYDNLPLPGSGVMRANTPWSGYYDVQPALWATAHTTQFANPGWKYLDGSGCGYLSTAGSYVTLKSTNGSDYSIIIETIDTGSSQTVTFNLTGGLSTGAVHVWRTNSSSNFVQLSDITPSVGSFTITLDGGSIYSLTTTTGQAKGTAAGPASSAFPYPYTDNFESYTVGLTPKYFSDQGGIFEVANRTVGSGKCLRQIMAQKGIEWHYHYDPYPETFLGNTGWTDYEVISDVYIENSGYVSIFGRVGNIPQNTNPPSGYWMKVDQAGNWEIKASSTTIASGTTSFSANAWHTLKLKFSGTSIQGYVDGVQIVGVSDSSYGSGMAGLGGGWNNAQFDNFTVQSFSGPTPTPDPASVNLALGKTASASSQWDSNYSADKANDGDSSNTRWNAADGTGAGEWLQIDFGSNITFDKTITKQFGNRIAGYKIQYWNGSSWIDAYTGGVMGTTPKTDLFTAVTASRIRLYVTSAQDDGGTYTCPSIWEFEVYNRSASGPTSTPTPTPTATFTPTPTPVSGGNLALGKTASASSQWDATYSADKANDGDSVNTRWNTANGQGAGQWLQIDFGANTTFNQTISKQFMNRITGYKIQYWNGSSWVDAYTGGMMGSTKTDTFSAVTSSRIRLYITSVQMDGNYDCPSIWEFEVYNTGGATPTPTPTPASNTSFATAVSLGSEIRNDYGDYVGMKITVGGSNITLKELGRYFVSGNSGSHTLKIVRASDNVDLGSVSINMATGTADALGYKYATLGTPVTLSANTAYYIVSLETNGGDQWYGRNPAALPHLTTTGAATVNSGIYYWSGVWYTCGSTGECYAPLNFKY